MPIDSKNQYLHCELDDDDLVSLTQDLKDLEKAKRLAAAIKSRQNATPFYQQKQVWSAQDDERKADDYETYNKRRRDQRRADAAMQGRELRAYVKNPSEEHRKAQNREAKKRSRARKKAVSEAAN